MMRYTGDREVTSFTVAEDAEILSVRRAALVIGHPGHELRLYGWLAAVRPQVFILTDGSGTTGIGRIASSSQVLAKTGSPLGKICAPFSDAGIYEAIRDCNIEEFLTLVDDLADTFMRDEIELVVSDANEGYNPTHDLCREIAQAAVEKVRHMSGRLIPHYEFCLTEWEHGSTYAHGERCVHTQLDHATLVAKIEASRAYAELQDEVDRALAVSGVEHFRVECLKRVDDWATIDETYKPQYEVWGEQRVAEGKYASVLRFRQHILPIFLALRAHASFFEPLLPAEEIQAFSL
jgi:hypothetical protein